MDLNAWKTLNRLIERALDLPVTERTTWLTDLGPEYEAFKPRLREMLDRLEATGPDALLDTLPKWATQVAEPSAGDAPEADIGRVVGPYRLVRAIASGGQGAVWLAERIDGLVDRPVALKLPAGLGTRRGLAERLARERDILARLTHPHIARLYDAGLSDIGPYLALEYVEGMAIDEHVASHQLDLRATLRLMLQVMDALGYAHGQLVLHRDIKPSNVIVTDDGQAQLLDFGIGKLLDEAPVDSTLTAAGGRALTLAYASPEQVSQASLGVATDVYSCAVLLYELLCGRRPHTPARDTRGALEDAILHDEPMRPSAAALDTNRRRALQGDLDAILLKGLRKRPEERYATVAAFADDLKAYLDGLPVAAQPDRPGYRARKFVARHRVAVVATAAVLVALVGGASVALWQAREARLERDRSDAVTAFVVSIFSDVDPTLQGPGRPLTAVDVLTLAQERLTALPDDDPSVRAELLRVLGTSFLSVGDATRANEVLTAARPAIDETYGPTSDEALTTRLRLALATQLLGKRDESDAHMAAVQQALEQTGRLDSETFVDLALMRIETLDNRGGAKNPEAATLSAAAVDAATRILGPRHAKRARALQLQGTVARTQNRHLEALAMSEEAYRLLAALHPDAPGHALVVLAQNEYGRSLMQVGRVREAMLQLDEAALLGLETFRNSPLTQQHLLGTLVNAQLLFGAVKEAVRNLEKAEAIDLKGVQLSPTYRAGQHVVRARALVAANRPADALGFYDKALALYRETSDANMGSQISAERGEALVRVKRFDEAERALTPFVAVATARPGPVTRRAQWLLGEIARQRGQRARALALLREAATVEGNTGRNRVLKAMTQVSLGQVLLEGGALDEATRALEEARQVFADTQGTMTPAHAEALAVLARVHLAAGRPEDARPLIEEAGRFWADFAPADEEAVRVTVLARQLSPPRPS